MFGIFCILAFGLVDVDGVAISPPARTPTVVWHSVVRQDGTAEVRHVTMPYRLYDECVDFLAAKDRFWARDLRDELARTDPYAPDDTVTVYPDLWTELVRALGPICPPHDEASSAEPE